MRRSVVLFACGLLVAVACDRVGPGFLGTRPAVIAVAPVAADAAVAAAPKSAVGGWRWLTPLPTGNALSAVFATDASNVCAVGGGGTIVRSTDGGATWTLAASGTDEGLAAVWGLGRDLLAVGDGGTIVRSSDLGATWAKVAGGGDGYLIDVSGGPHEALIVADDGGVLRSVDGGASWTRRPSGAAGLMAVCDLGTGEAFAAGDSSAILRSADGGLSWAPVHGGGTDEYSAITSDGHTVLVTGEKGLVRSTDHGRTWVGGAATLELRSLRFVGGDLLAIANTSIGASSELLRSTDGGATFGATPWAGPESGLASGPGGAVYAVGMAGQISVSTDAGHHFVERTPAARVDLQAIAGSGAVLIAAGSDGKILRSTDRGGHWTAIETGTPQFLATLLATPSGDLFASGEGGLVLRSRDAGLTWSALRTGTTQGLYALWAGSGGLVVAAGQGGTVLRSTDGGATFAPAATPTTGTLEALWGDGAQLVAVGEHGVILRSTDRGVTWSAAAVTWPSDGVPASLVGVGGRAGNLFAAGAPAFEDEILPTGGGMGGGEIPTGSVLLRSTDGGATFAPAWSSGGDAITALWVGPHGVATAMEEGEVLRFGDDGKPLAPDATGCDERLTGLWGDGRGVLYAVGSGGAILRGGE